MTDPTQLNSIFRLVLAHHRSPQGFDELERSWQMTGRLTCVYRKSDSEIVVVKSTEDRP